MMIKTEANGTEGTPDDTSGGDIDVEGVDTNGQQYPDVPTVKQRYVEGEIGDAAFEALIEKSLAEHGFETSESQESTRHRKKRQALMTGIFFGAILVLLPLAADLLESKVLAYLTLVLPIVMGMVVIVAIVRRSR